MQKKKFPSFIYITTFILDFHGSLHSSHASIFFWGNESINTDVQPWFHTYEINTVIVWIFFIWKVYLSKDLKNTEIIIKQSVTIEKLGTVHFQN